MQHITLKMCPKHKQRNFILTLTNFPDGSLRSTQEKQTQTFTDLRDLRFKNVLYIKLKYRRAHKTVELEDDCWTQVMILISSLNIKHSNNAMHSAHRPIYILCTLYRVYTFKNEKNNFFNFRIKKMNYEFRLLLWGVLLGRFLVKSLN